LNENKLRKKVLKCEDLRSKLIFTASESINPTGMVNIKVTELEIEPRASAQYVSRLRIDLSLTT
jgi:hypothetical protein